MRSMGKVIEDESDTKQEFCQYKIGVVKYVMSCHLGEGFSSVGCASTEGKTLEDTGFLTLEDCTTSKGAVVLVFPTISRAFTIHGA